MKRANLLTKLQKTGIVSVVRANTSDKAVKIADAVIAGGITGIELTYTVPNADQVINELVERYQDTPEVIIGAGTVLDATSARLAIISGANFIVSPTFDTNVAKMCNLYQIPYIPGVFTPTEAQAALQAGSEVVKLFPGSLATPKTISEFKGPFPYINVMPSGGVNADNISDWFAAGAFVVGAGNSLVAPAQQNNFAGVTANARAFMSKYHEIMSLA